MRSDLYKFGFFPNDGEEPYLYDDCYAFEETSGPVRLAVTTSGSYVELLNALLVDMAEPLWLLYVLAVSRTDTDSARYQCAAPLARAEVAAFLTLHGAFLEQDGRHNLWICPESGPANLLVYDRHNVIYAYGALEAYERVLLRRGLHRVDRITFPDPHAHHYHRHFDPEQEQILTGSEWVRSPLKIGDVNPDQ